MAGHGESLVCRWWAAMEQCICFITWQCLLILREFMLGYSWLKHPNQPYRCYFSIDHVPCSGRLVLRHASQNITVAGTIPFGC